MQGAKNHQGYRVQNLFTKAEYMAAMYLANQSKWCLAIGEGPYMGINNECKPFSYQYSELADYVSRQSVARQGFCIRLADSFDSSLHLDSQFSNHPILHSVE
jgi:hypothetical protein